MAHEGVMFKRATAGVVQLWRTYDGVPLSHGFIIEFDAIRWASIVAGASKHGDTARAFGLAERFHDGKWTEAKGHPR